MFHVLPLYHYSIPYIITRYTILAAVVVTDPPVIGVSGVQNTNDCQLSADKTKCVVTEGRRVHINSTADSNPDPETFRWRKQADSGLDLGTTSVLDIVSTNHVLHNGLYNLTVTSGDLGNGRGRLTETKELNILVLCKLASMFLLRPFLFYRVCVRVCFCVQSQILMV